MLLQIARGATMCDVSSQHVISILFKKWRYNRKYCRKRALCACPEQQTFFFLRLDSLVFGRSTFFGTISRRLELIARMDDDRSCTKTSSGSFKRVHPPDEVEKENVIRSLPDSPKPPVRVKRQKLSKAPPPPKVLTNINQTPPILVVYKYKTVKFTYTHKDGT